MPRWFLLLNGAALLIMGLVLLPMRLRERPLHRHVFGIAWAILCSAVGIALLLMAQGFIEQPGRPPADRPALRGAPQFPTGR